MNARPAYILLEYPRPSETFIARELQALSMIGQPVWVGAVQRPAAVSPPAIQVAPDTCYADTVTFGERGHAARTLIAHRPRRCRRLFGQLVADTLRYPRAFVPAWRRLPLALAWAIRIERWGATSLHAHFAFLPADLARLMAILTDLPYTVAAHAQDIHTQPADILARRLRGAAAIAACSRDGAQTLRAKLGPAIRLYAIPHGIPLQDFHGRQRPALFTILAAGRLVPKKGFVHLIRACAILRRAGRHFQCIIAGAGDEQPALQAAALAEQVADCVTFVGWQSPAALRERYRSASVFVHPGIELPDGDRDGVPNVLLEAMAMRVPVVATRVGGIPEAIQDGVTGYLVDQASPVALAARLEQLMDAAEDTDRAVGNAARATVEREYDMLNNIKRLTAMFETIAGTAHAS
jgi:glycosyltransferase involved in cell wall biosynthesis